MSYVGMATNIAGTELQGWASMLEKWAMERAYADEIKRQAAYQTEATGVFDKQLPSHGATSFGQQLGEAALSREGNYGDLAKVPLSVTPEVATERDKLSAAMQGAQRAKLGSYQDVLFNQKMGDLGTGRSLDQISNFAAGTGRVFPYRMYAAEHSQDALAEIGAALSSIGGGGYQGPKNDFPGKTSSSMNYTGGIDSGFWGDPNTYDQMQGMFGSQWGSGPTQQDINAYFASPVY